MDNDILTETDFQFIDDSIDKMSKAVGFDVNEMLAETEVPELSTKKILLQPIPEPINLSFTPTKKIKVRFIFEILNELRNLVKTYKERGEKSLVYKFDQDGFSTDLKSSKELFPYVQLVVEKFWKPTKCEIALDFKTVTLSW